MPGLAANVAAVLQTRTRPGATKPRAGAEIRKSKLENGKWALRRERKRASVRPLRAAEKSRSLPARHGGQAAGRPQPHSQTMRRAERKMEIGKWKMGEKRAGVTKLEIRKWKVAVVSHKFSCKWFCRNPHLGYAEGQKQIPHPHSRDQSFVPAYCGRRGTGFPSAALGTGGMTAKSGGRI